MSDFTVFDIETTGSTPWTGELLRVGIGEVSWRMPRGREKMRALLARPGVVVEHTLYDARWALLDGATLGPATEIHDTRVMAWLLDEEQPLDLESLVARYLGLALRKPIRQRGGRIMFDLGEWKRATGAPELVPIEEVPAAIMDEYSSEDLVHTAALYERLRTELDNTGLWKLFVDVEVPVARELALMESRGLPFDEETNDELRVEVRAEADALEADLQEEMGAPLNLRSPSQLAAVLFAPTDESVRVKAKPHRMSEAQAARVKECSADARLDLVSERWFGLPPRFVPTRVGRDLVHGEWLVQGRGLAGGSAGFGGSKATDREEKARPSTSAVPLVMANPGDPFAASFAYYKELDKLEGSFLGKFPTYVHEGRLYGTVNRCGTVTGRLSSANPNLQNIPAHGRHGLAVRALFRGDLALGDYAQLEQRIAAHLSGDPVLLKAYRDGVDLYGLVASMLFGGPASKDNDQRGLMKTGMLAIQYGAGANKLAQLIMIDRADQMEFKGTGTAARQMGGALFRVTSAGHTLEAGHVDKASEAEAEVLLEKLQAALPEYFGWREDLARKAARDGFTRSLSGRYRHLEFPERWVERRRRAYKWYDRETAARGFALERQAVNAECQGGAADVVNGAMVQLAVEMPEETQVLIQVHDEIVAERLEGWHAGSLTKMREICEERHGYELQVPLEFEAMEAPSWAAKGGTIANAKQLFQQRAKLDETARRSQGMLSRKASDIARVAMKDRSFGNGGVQPGRSK